MIMQFDEFNYGEITFPQLILMINTKRNQFSYCQFFNKVEFKVFGLRKVTSNGRAYARLPSLLCKVPTHALFCIYFLVFHL